MSHALVFMMGEFEARFPTESPVRQQPHVGSADR